MAKRIKASVLRDFTVPEDSDEESSHGSQRETAIILAFLPGWGRECSDAAYLAHMPGVVNSRSGKPTKEVSDRGRGKVLIDAFRVNPARANGGDFLGIKAPKPRKGTGKYPSSVELFKGTRATLAIVLENIRDNHAHRKAQPLAVVHTDGDTFAPNLIEWCILDLGSLLSEREIKNGEDWETWAGVPAKPENDPPRGAGGSPASVWVTMLRREQAGMVKGKQTYRFVPDDSGHYATLNTTVSKRRGHRFIAGSAADFEMDVDAATVLR